MKIVFEFISVSDLCLQSSGFGGGGGGSGVETTQVSIPKDVSTPLLILTLEF